MAAARSAFVLSKVRHDVSLSPCHIAEPRVGVEQEMTALLMRYSEPLRGVVLAFSNVRLATPLGHIINEMPYIHCKVLADALVFQPQEGMVLRGTVNKIGSNHVGMLFAGVFNGSVAASELPKGYVHNYAQDAWLDAQGNSIAVDDVVEVKVLRVHVAGGMIAIEASMRGVKQSAKTASSSTGASKKVAKAAKKKVEKEVKVEPKKAEKKPKKSTKSTTETTTETSTSSKPSKKSAKKSSSDAMKKEETETPSKPSKKRKNAEAAAAAVPAVDEPKKSKKKKSKKDE